eukprot:5395411-Amphidinium_carterae.1
MTKKSNEASWRRNRCYYGLVKGTSSIDGSSLDCEGIGYQRKILGNSLPATLYTMPHPDDCRRSGRLGLDAHAHAVACRLRFGVGAEESNGAMRSGSECGGFDMALPAHDAITQHL